MSNGGGLKSTGKELLIDFYLEFSQDEFIAKLKMILAPLTPDILRQLVTDGKAPSIHEAVVESLRGYEDYLGRLPPEELFEWLNKARPDLAETLMSLGESGAKYMVMLKFFIIDSIKAPATAPGEPELPAPKENAQEQLFRCVCDSCGKASVVTKEDFEAMKLCPFCGVEKGGPTPEQEPEPE